MLARTALGAAARARAVAMIRCSALWQVKLRAPNVHPGPSRPGGIPGNEQLASRALLGLRALDQVR